MFTRAAARAPPKQKHTVLGAQVQTRWSIVGSGAKSYQTQTIFHQIVQETIVQGNDAILVSNMRSAI